MSLPREQYRVEWTACRHPDRPHERVDRQLTTSNKWKAGDQVAEVLAWPGYLELRGVWRTVGWSNGRLVWGHVDPSKLPTSPGKAARLRKLRQHSVDYARMLRMTPGDIVALYEQEEPLP